ncbi:FAD-binding protein [Roseovarius sp. SCSIO 43702]|uniref:FAD-binding protein n=1 Tax=Roseovarius sp. SCSIO 43702 TaxID=2823043 RepID=UPI001C738C55|nr:FAD-binding protein [Roseovarius sp. SCSIO 43702]QYX56597.1 FAD-binding protein [Roseovarius sp. SCSIO 43702]
MTPETEADLAEIVRGANDPLSIEGGGTRPIGGPRGGTRLSTRAMTGITLYEPGALTLVVRAGTALEEVEQTLAAEGQALAFEPMDHRGILGTTGTPTIGGVVAMNASGPRRVSSVGACRDHLLGVRFVDGQGRIVRNGGRVMKNVTGYDLVKLMAGSMGRLGVLTEVSLKVLPAPRHTATLSCEGLADGAAVALLARALGSPYEVTGAAHLQAGASGVSRTLVRIEGAEASVAYRAEQLRARLSDAGEITLETDREANAETWAGIRDAAPFHDHPGEVWRLSVKPSDAPALVAGLEDARAIYDWGGGLVWLTLPEGADGAALRDAVSGLGGHATRYRGGRGPALHPPAPAIATLEAGLRARFDPRGIFAGPPA